MASVYSLRILNAFVSVEDWNLAVPVIVRPVLSMAPVRNVSAPAVAHGQGDGHLAVAGQVRRHISAGHRHAANVHV